MAWVLEAEIANVLSDKKELPILSNWKVPIKTKWIQISKKKLEV